MKSKGIALLLGLFAMAMAVAQKNIEVSVMAQDTNIPVAGAVITYGNRAEDLKQSATTNTEGKASLLLNALPCYYKITAKGYVVLKGSLEQDSVTLYLQKTTDTNRYLGEMVVLGSKVSPPVKKSAVLTQVISGKQLTDAGYGDLQQALIHETPGMNIQKVGFGNEMNMQGLDARHVLFLLDGERLTGEMAGNLDYERFNLHAIDHVEIVKGASSTLYGSRASGAVINLITKKTKRPFALNAGIRYGQMNERNYKNPRTKDFLYMFEKNSDHPNLQAWLSGGMKQGIFTTQTDIWYSSFDAFYMYQKEKDKKVYTAQANPFLQKDTVLISYLDRPPMGISGSEHISMAQKVYIEPSKNLRMQLYGTAFFMNTYDLIQDLYFTQSKDYTGGVKLSYMWKDYLSISATLHSDFYERYKRHERRDVRKKVYDSRIWQPRLRLKSNYFKNHKLVGGVDYLQDDLTSDRFVNQKMTTRGLKEWEFFIQDSYHIIPQLEVEGGVRTNFSKPFGFMVLPKLALKYSPNDVLSWRINYAMGFRSPSIKELFFNWDHLGMFQIIGDEKLQPEKNQYFSLGVEYDKRRFFISVNAYGNFFYKKIEGVWKIYDFQYNFEYMNLKNQRLLGTDILMRWKINHSFLLNGSYSYVNVKDSYGVRINTTSPHAATAELTYKWRKGRNYKLRATLSTSFTGAKSFDVQDRLNIKERVKMKDGSYQERTRSKDAYFRCELPAYVLCNLNVTQTFWRKYSLSLGVNNLFNYVPSTLGSGVTMFNIPATAGARAFVQLEYNF